MRGTFIVEHSIGTVAEESEAFLGVSVLWNNCRGTLWREDERIDVLIVVQSYAGF
jgi:hypothetical protein